MLGDFCFSYEPRSVVPAGAAPSLPAEDLSVRAQQAKGADTGSLGPRASPQNPDRGDSGRNEWDSGQNLGMLSARALPLRGTKDTLA